MRPEESLRSVYTKEAHVPVQSFCCSCYCYGYGYAAAAAATNHQWRTGTSLPTPSSTNPASLDHYPETFPIAEPPQFRRRPSLTRPGSGGHDAARTIESLVHRVQNLEQLLSQSTSKTPANLGSSSAAETTPQQVRGTLSKTRLFGQSHWMTPLEQVLKANCLA